MIYMDSSATSFLKPPQVEKAVIEALHTMGNAGRGAHAPTLNASRMVYGTRERLAKLFGIKDPSRIAFTSNATESLNVAIGGLFGSGDHVITTACEHNSVLRPLYRKEEEGMELTILPADSRGYIVYEELERVCKPNTKAVVVTHASNLTGNVTDLERVAAFTMAHQLLLVVDASQTAGSLPIDVEEMNIDVLCFTGHKGLMGPQGTGGIYVREGLEIAPLKVGGSGVHSFERQHPAQMPTALEAGTMNVHGIAGLHASLAFLLETGVENIHQKEMELVEQFCQGLCEMPEIHVYGDFSQGLRAPIVTLNIGTMDSAAVSDILWEDYEICVRPGAHCAPLMHEALGTVEQGAVRFSFSYFNTKEEVDIALSALHDIVEEYREEQP